GGVVPAWAWVAAGAGRAGLLRAATVLAGCLLGAAMAGAYLVPALLLLPEINADGWDTGGLTTWSGHFLLDAWTPSKPVVHFVFMNAGLLVSLAVLAALAWTGRRQAPAERDPFFVATAVLFLGLCLLMTPLSWPLWWALPPLQRVQFPWRLMTPAVAVWALVVAWRLERLAEAGVPEGTRIAVAAGAAFAAMALWIPYSLVTADMPAFARYDWTRLHVAPAGERPLPRRHPPEYAPIAAARAGWRAEEAASDAILQA
ncbi:hypothetical protein, partial [Falsiroseomonas oryzae]|uniref:hypothetical protein n=1 Tax=Falsiroseomonas oryzae TaxID=2766473 RepID=UPI0022EB5A29